MIASIIFQLEAPGDDEETILKDATEDTIPVVEDVEEGNMQTATQVEHTGAGDNCKGDEV
jgi:hypothetical protein